MQKYCFNQHLKNDSSWPTKMSLLFCVAGGVYIIFQESVDNFEIRLSTNHLRFGLGFSFPEKNFYVGLLTFFIIISMSANKDEWYKCKHVVIIQLFQLVWYQVDAPSLDTTKTRMVVTGQEHPPVHQRNRLHSTL